MFNIQHIFYHCVSSNMDFDLLRDGEQFSNYLGYFDENGSTLDSMHDLSTDKMYHWNTDNEIQINGDLEVIPICNNFYDINLRDGNNLSNVNIHIMNNWQHFVDVETNPKENITNDIDQFLDQDEKDDLLNLSNATNFDITAYLKDDYPSQEIDQNRRKHRAGIKRIDMEAQKYILDEEDDIDVETVSEGGDPSPILQAGDLNSLLEQFEASEIPDLTLPDEFLEPESNTIKTNEPTTFKINLTQDNLLRDSSIECKPVVKIKHPDENKLLTVKKDKTIHEIMVANLNSINNEPLFLDHKIQSIENVEQEVKETKIKQELRKQVERKQSEDIKCEKEMKVTKCNSQINKDDFIVMRQISTSSYCYKNQTPQKIVSKICANNFHKSTPVIGAHNAMNLEKTKQIINALPQELIDRIRESGKRKCISVIEPIVPYKKQRTMRENITTVVQNQSAFVVPNIVQLDHDYCSHSTICLKGDKKKDSGFESEEEERTVIEKQPVIKNADGKLMVSLLKVNTIREEKTSKKKKLNFEEYKKRREGIWKSQCDSQNNSPLSSTCSSPLPEDEEVRRRKHQEKLMKMAMEVLRTPVKSVKKELRQVIAVPKITQIPPDVEMKTLVSIGVNTEMKRKKNVDPLAPVEQLEQIKPVLQKISDKINSNSLITSVIENIPKVMSSCSAENSNSKSILPKVEHGEDKTIVYLPKDRVPPKRTNISTQTNISLIQQTKASRYRRRRNSSTSSNSSNDSHCSRLSARIQRENSRSNISTPERFKSVRSSRSSVSSYSSRSYSRSRSRSISPGFSTRQERERERFREVEERRVIYVGRLTKTTTKEILRKRFQRFGSITNISLHSRQQGDRYGFVTFANKLDAYKAIEHGNDDPYYPKFDLSFGGRRIFCQTSYSDLDNMREEIGYYTAPRPTEDSFDNLLKEVQEKLRKRKV